MLLGLTPSIVASEHNRTQEERETNYHPLMDGEMRIPMNMVTPWQKSTKFEVEKSLLAPMEPHLKSGHEIYMLSNY